MGIRLLDCGGKYFIRVKNDQEKITVDFYTDNIPSLLVALAGLYSLVTVIRKFMDKEISVGYLVIGLIIISFVFSFFMKWATVLSKPSWTRKFFVKPNSNEKSIPTDHIPIKGLASLIITNKETRSIIYDDQPIPIIPQRYITDYSETSHLLINNRIKVGITTENTLISMMDPILYYKHPGSRDVFRARYAEYLYKLMRKNLIKHDYEIIQLTPEVYLSEIFLVDELFDDAN